MRLRSLFRTYAAAAALCTAIFSCACTAGTAYADEAFRRLNVAYIEGGNFIDYEETLRCTARALAEMGMLQNKPFISRRKGTQQHFWKKLSRTVGGSFSFLPDGFYSAGWDPAKRAENADALRRRIREKGDVDLVIAMGTQAGIDMTREDLGVPVLVMSCTNALAAGIVSGVERSGRPNVHAEMEPSRYADMFDFFHDTFPVAKVGIAYETTPEAMSASGVAEILEAARRRGVEIVESHAVFRVSDPALNAERLRDCVKDMLDRGAESIFFVYTTTEPERMPYVLEPLRGRAIPTFAQAGPAYVENGVLMCMTQFDFAAVGRFEAGVMKAVSEGMKPHDIDQVFSPGVGLALNLPAAMDIGWTPPLEILVALDKVYRHRARP